MGVTGHVESLLLVAIAGLRIRPYVGLISTRSSWVRLRVFEFRHSRTKIMFDLAMHMCTAGGKSNMQRCKVFGHVNPQLVAVFLFQNTPPLLV